MGRAQSKVTAGTSQRRANDSFVPILGEGRGLSAIQRAQRANDQPLSEEESTALRLLAVYLDDWVPGLLEPGDYGDELFDGGLLVSGFEQTALTAAGEAAIDRAIWDNLDARSIAFCLLVSAWEGVTNGNAAQVEEDVAAGLLLVVEDDGVTLTAAGAELVRSALQLTVGQSSLL